MVDSFEGGNANSMCVQSSKMPVDLELLQSIPIPIEILCLLLKFEKGDFEVLL